MIRLLAGNLWKEIKQRARSNRRKLAAVAYVTSEIPVRFRKPDVLIVNASNNAIAYGQTSAKVLKRAFHSGAEIYNCPELHAKIFLFDGVAIIGSANISKLSQSYLFEAGVLTDQLAIVSPARAYFEWLKRKSGPIDKRFIQRICAIKVKLRFPFPPHGVKSAVSVPPMSDHKTWLVAVWETHEKPSGKKWIAKGERAAKQNRTRKSSDVSWIRFSGNSSFRKQARSGDSLIQIWHSRGKRKRVLVYRAQPILHRQPEPSRTRFFIEDYSNGEHVTLSWPRFKQIAKQAGLPHDIKPGAVRDLRDGQADLVNRLWPKRQTKRGV